MTNIYFLFGATCAGKTSLCDLAITHGDGVVQVGKMLRAKYPPEYFNGQANPSHTQEEAWQLMIQGVADCRAHKADRVFVDGQPRDYASLVTLFDMLSDPHSYPMFADTGIHFIHMFATLGVRRMRAMRRDGDDPKRRALTESRLMGDVPDMYEMLSFLHIRHTNDHPISIRHFNSGVALPLVNYRRLTNNL